MLYLKRHPFLFFAAALIAFQVFLIVNGDIGGDFMEHASVVNELTRHPLHPSNPVISADIPHAFFSPYSLIAAFFSRLTGLDAVQTLQYFFSFFNLALFIFCFYSFCKSFFKENTQLIAALGLLFILFFWGKDPFPWSGFYHLLVLTAVLSYPSTFAMALSLLVLSLLAKESFEKYITGRKILMILLNTVILLSHPTTGIQLFLGIIAYNFCFNNYSVKEAVIRSSLLILPALLLSFCWPYFNTFDLLFGNNEDFQNASKLMYRAVLSKNWPFFLLIPGLFVVRRNVTVIFFCTYLGLLILVYFTGYLSNHYIIGRLISGIMFFSQILLAYMLVTAIIEKRTRAMLFAGLAGIAFIGSVYRNRIFLERLSSFPSQKMHNRFYFLKAEIRPDDVVMSDKKTNRAIPAFSGKVIASAHPMYHVYDLEERRQGVNDFFAIETTDSVRQELLKKYHASYILIDHMEVILRPATLAWLENKAGIVVYKKDELELIRLNK